MASVERYFKSILSLMFAIIDLVSWFENLSKWDTNVILGNIPALVAINVAIWGYLDKYFSTKVSFSISLNKSLSFLTTKYCFLTSNGSLIHSLIEIELFLYVWFTFSVLDKGIYLNIFFNPLTEGKFDSIKLHPSHLSHSVALPPTSLFDLSDAL